MKIKLPVDLLIIDILSVILILSIIFIPAAAARVILGLPFLLFFLGMLWWRRYFPRVRWKALNVLLSASG